MRTETHDALERMSSQSVKDKINAVSFYRSAYITAINKALMVAHTADDFAKINFEQRELKEIIRILKVEAAYRTNELNSK